MLLKDVPQMLLKIVPQMFIKSVPRMLLKTVPQLLLKMFHNCYSKIDPQTLLKNWSTTVTQKSGQQLLL